MKTYKFVNTFVVLRQVVGAGLSMCNSCVINIYLKDKPEAWRITFDNPNDALQHLHALRANIEQFA